MKTTLIDKIPQQTDTKAKANNTLIMDSNDLEMERGITMIQDSKVEHQNCKINIDTPGHADFGEVEQFYRWSMVLINCRCS